MHDHPSPKLIPSTLKGDPTCGYRLTESDAPCGRPATWHIAWTLVTPADFSLMCDEHLARVNAQWAYADRHPAKVICDMPGFGWLIGAPSRCVLVTTEDCEAQGTREEVSHR